jgi:anti-sigma B factor antagonist
MNTGTVANDRVRGELNMPETEAELSVRKQGDVSVVEIKSRKVLDELQIQQIGERLSEIADENEASKMLIDFTSVEHLSSAALSVLIHVNRQISSNNGQLVLASIQPQIYEVFKITRLDKLFTIADTTESGLNAFS